MRNEKLTCDLCPHACRLVEGAVGLCRVRKNEGGKIVSLNYGKICSAGFDPIEKKPLYHFYPSRTILSIGSVGCNLRCKFCQNWEISQSGINDFDYLREYSSQDIIDIAGQRKENIGIAYTYNEPTVFYEFMMDTAKLAKQNGYKNVVVSNGFINQSPLLELIDVIDAFSIDLKAFTEDFYSNLTHSSLQPVLESLKTIKRSEKLLEITNLIVTNQNDNPKEFTEMVNWIASELGPDTVFHISRYYPTYKLNEPPTSTDTLLQFYEIAREKLPYTYLGNIATSVGQNTFCPDCGETLIIRNRYSTEITKKMGREGNCLTCGYHIMDYLYL